MNTKVYLISSIVVSFGAGCAAGYLFTKRQLEAQYSELSKREIAEAKTYYAMLHKRDDFSTPEKAADKLLPKLAELTDQQVVDVTEAALALREYSGAELVNVFQNKDQSDVVDKNTPYPISEDAYMANEDDHDQVSLTYYTGDKVLVDERDEPIEFLDNSVGADFAENFEDSNTLYIRNTSLETDFEITAVDGKYTVHVLGMNG